MILARMTWNPKITDCSRVTLSQLLGEEESSVICYYY